MAIVTSGSLFPHRPTIASRLRRFRRRTYRNHPTLNTVNAFLKLGHSYIVHIEETSDNTLVVIDMDLLKQAFPQSVADVAQLESCCLGKPFAGYIRDEG
jgi:hypothetical protein